MFKKLVSIGIAAVLLFSLLACGNKNPDEPPFDLEEYKIETKAELDSFFLVLDEWNYSDENWLIIAEVIESAKEDIDAATDKDGVDLVCEAAKTEIDTIADGDDFNLAKYKKAANDWLDNHFLGLDEEVFTQIIWLGIKNIIKYAKENIDEAADKDEVDSVFETAEARINSFLPMDKDEMLGVKQSYVEFFLEEDYPEATIDDVRINEYLGTYDGKFIAVIRDKYNSLYFPWSIELFIEGLNFTYTDGFPIRVCYDGEFYLLEVAYAQGLLTRVELETIHQIYRSKYY